MFGTWAIVVLCLGICLGILLFVLSERGGE